MLLNSFFYIDSVKGSDEVTPAGHRVKKWLLEVRLEPSHPIFSGHFPGNPVVPGVCQVQMITESLRSVTATAVMLLEADNIKFLSMINPLVTNRVVIELLCREPGESIRHIQAVIRDENTAFLKFKGIYS